MTRFVYVNGAHKRYAEAAVHAEDRGFQFADAIYEVIEVLDGGLVDATRHLARLERSLRELSIPPPMSKAALLQVIDQVIRRNRVRDGIVYLQVTRGAGPRDFALPAPKSPPTLVRDGHRREDHTRQSLGPLRYQNGHAAAGSSRQGRSPPGRGA